MSPQLHISYSGKCVIIRVQLVVVIEVISDYLFICKIIWKNVLFVRRFKTKILLLISTHKYFYYLSFLILINK